MTEQDIEKEIQDKGLIAPRLTPELINSVIVSETFTILPSAKAMICELTLINGFTVRGESACVSKANFNKAIGEVISRENARKKIWELEGYLLQDRLHSNTQSVREGNIAEALGWMHEEACVSLDNGEDLRKKEIGELLKRALRELSS